MHCVRDGFSEIIEWSKDAKKLSKEWVDDDSEKKREQTEREGE